MKITPAAIRQKSFEVGFRGYEKKDVTAFLEEVSEVVDQLHKENMELKTKLQNTEAEAKRLKDVEESLFRTLKTAEDTGASIIVEANEAADLIISEANETAENATKHIDQMIGDAKTTAEQQAAAIIGAAEAKAKETIVNLRENMQGLVRSYEGLAEQREAMVKSLRRIAQDALNQVDLSEAHYSRIDAKAHARAIDELSRSQTYTFDNLQNLGYEEKPEPTAPAPEPGEFVESTPVAEEPEYHHEEVADADIDEQEMEELELQETKMELEDENLEEDLDEPVKTRIEEPAPKQVESRSKEEPKNQSGSFFDQFD